MPTLPLTALSRQSVLLRCCSNQEGPRLCLVAGVSISAGTCIEVAHCIDIPWPEYETHISQCESLRCAILVPDEKDDDDEDDDDSCLPTRVVLLPLGLGALFQSTWQAPNVRYESFVHERKVVYFAARDIDGGEELTVMSTTKLVLPEQEIIRVHHHPDGLAANFWDFDDFTTKPLIPPDRLHIRRVYFDTEAFGRGVFLGGGDSTPRGSLIEVSPTLFLTQHEEDAHCSKTVLEKYVYTFRNATGRCMLLALGIGSLFNHSDKPNLSYRIVKLTTTRNCHHHHQHLFIIYTAARDIEPGEELTISYGTGVWWLENNNEGDLSHDEEGDAGDGLPFASEDW